MKHLILGLILAVAAVFSLVVPAQADENFSTNLQTTYTVNSTGQTQVTQIIRLTNKTPTLYATQYGLKIGSPDLQNVTVSSNGQRLNPEVVSTQNQTTIGVTFPDELVGEGKTRELEISYISPGSAVVSGQVLEVLVPGLGTGMDYESYQVTLVTPGRFGLPTRATPASYNTHAEGNQIITGFSPQNGESVTALFGQQQIFETRLRYNLENTSTNPGIAQIALPPDTPYQKLSYQVLEPQPQSLAHDNDGNWIATYEVGPQSTLTVYAVAKVLITLDPAPNFPQTPVRNSLTSSQEFWERNAPSITETAASLPDVRAIYDHVVDTLTYDFSSLGREHPRLGAVNALANPTQAVCQEFADLFIALARAKNIPTRRLTGYAYTQNPNLRPLSVDQDILHAWVEYYDDDTHQWKQLDPTWENTTGGVNYFDQFDLNHIVFAINGESSKLPYPAGSYKLENRTDKDVEVVFSQDFPTEKPLFDVEIQPRKIGGISLPGKQYIQLSNQTGRAWYHVQLNPKVVDGSVTLEQEIETIPVILPFQTVSIPLGLYSPNVSFKEETPLQLSLSYTPDIRSNTSESPIVTQSNDQTTVTIQLKPVRAQVGPGYFQVLTSPAGLIGLGIGSLVLTGLAGSVLVLGYRRPRPVRRKS